MTARAGPAVVQAVDTPGGPARAVINAATMPRARVVLGHGAGGGIDAIDLRALAEALPARGFTVVRVEQPWRVAGRKVAGPPARLDEAWTAVLARIDGGPGGHWGVSGAPLVVGGRSAGARVACRTAGATGARAVVALAFPLHPPGRPQRSRVDELRRAGVPTLVVQGCRDPFGGPAEFPAGTRLLAVEHADHGFHVPARAPVSRAEVLDGLVTGVADWLEDTFA